MKNLAVLALCFFTSFASANDKQIEEVKVTAKKVVIVMPKLSDCHKQNPITGNWYYVKEVKKNKA